MSSDFKVVIYTTVQRWTRDAAERFAQGLKAHGVYFECRDIRDVVDCDLAVVWAHRSKHVFERATDYIVQERGYIGDRFYWTSLGFNNLNGRAEFCTEGVGPDRWDSHFPDLMQPWKGAGDNCLITAQSPGDASLAMMTENMRHFYERVSLHFADKGYKVRFRPHPNRPVPYTPRGSVRSNAETIGEDLDWADVCVAWNSNSLTDAVLRGVPVYALDRGAMAWPVAATSLDMDPIHPDRSEWAHRLAYCQWSPDEISSGLAWDHLRRFYDGR